jgi:uncharacterized membrane protein YeaQ/YmgE (transglycosylase-associated protein family)
MGLIFFLLFGFVVGLLGRALMPGRQDMGIVMTTLVGVAGSFIGGFLSSLVTGHRVTDLHTAGLIGSVIGALLLLFIVSALNRPRARV